MLLNIKRVFLFSLQLSSEMFLILGRINRDIIIKYESLHVKYPLFLSDFNETFIYSTDFRKTPNYKISTKSVMWDPSCSTRTVEQMTELIVAFRHFAKAPIAITMWKNMT